MVQFPNVETSTSLLKDFVEGASDYLGLELSGDTKRDFNMLAHLLSYFDSGEEPILSGVPDLLGCEMQETYYPCGEGMVKNNCTLYCQRIGLLKGREEKVAELFDMSIRLSSTHGEGLCRMGNKEGCWNNVATELGMCASNNQRKNGRRAHLALIREIFHCPLDLQVYSTQ